MNGRDFMVKPFYEVRDFETIRDIIDQGAELYKDRPAFEVKRGNEHYNISYIEYREDINALSTALLKYGAENAAVAAVGDNCYEYCLTYISTICSSGVIVPIDKELHQEDIYSIIKTADAKFVFCDTHHIDKIKVDKLAEKGIKIICFDLKESTENIISLKDFMAEGQALIDEGKPLYKDVKYDVNKLCTLLFTSGTTGVSKGVMLCQRNFVFEVKAAMGVLKIYPEDCGISLLPIHHTFESSIILFFAPYCGAKVTFCEGFKYVLRNMKEFNPSIFVAVPLVLEIVHGRIMKEIAKKKHGKTMFKIGKAICKAGSKFGLDFKKVFFKEIQETFGGNMRMIICGGAAIDPQIIKDFDAFGIQIVYGYGLTECAPLAVINHDRLRTTDSIGEPLPGVETKIINKDENDIGELCVKGGMVMLGYYKNPEATAEVIDKDGFFHTGDLCYIDRKGHYHITGRCKNVIVTSNGKNIYPEELEYHLDSSSFIAASMVEGIDNNHGDLTVHAQIFPAVEEIEEVLGKKPTQQEIYDAVKSNVDSVNAVLPDFKRIRSFTVRDKDFERTTAQKIKREKNKSTVKKNEKTERKSAKK